MGGAGLAGTLKTFFSKATRQATPSMRTFLKKSAEAEFSHVRRQPRGFDFQRRLAPPLPVQNSPLHFLRSRRFCPQFSKFPFIHENFWWWWEDKWTFLANFAWVLHLRKWWMFWVFSRRDFSCLKEFYLRSFGLFFPNQKQVVRPFLSCSHALLFAFDIAE